MSALSSRVGWVALALIALAASACGANHSLTGAKRCVGPEQSFYVASAAMEPTINTGRDVTVDQGAYRAASPQRGDIVVFTTASIAARVSPGVQDIIKRIIGLPGESISSSPTGQVLVNGHPIAQPWLSRVTSQDPGPPISALTIPAGTYYVLGDNRGNSEDSRFYGPVPMSSIVGKVMLGGCG